MTNYHRNPITFSLAGKATKIARQKQLEAVRKRRYKAEQERRKHQQNAYSTSKEYREYQERLKEEANLYH